MPAIGRRYSRGAKRAKGLRGGSRPPTAPPEWICTLDCGPTKPAAASANASAQVEPLIPPTEVPPGTAEVEPYPSPEEQTTRTRGPVVRLFNSVQLLAYETEVVMPMDADRGCAVLALWRGVFDEAGMERLVQATVRERCAFTPPADAITWGDVVNLVEASGAAGVDTAAGSLEWDLRVFRCDPCITDAAQWTFATPPLGTQHERSVFLSTDVEVLFCHYRSPLLYVWLSHEPLEEPAAVAVDATLPSSASPHSPLLASTASEKLSKVAPPLLDTTPPTTAPSGGGKMLPEATPRPQRRRDTLCRLEWAAAAFVCQLSVWQALLQELQARVEGKAPPFVLETVRAELRAWASRPCAEWNGAWMLSLREYECDVLLDAVAYMAARGASGGRGMGTSPAVSHEQVCRCLGQCRRGVQRTLAVLTRINEAGEVKELMIPPGAFPFALQRVLLLALELRALRHASIVEATTGDLRLQRQVVLRAGRAARRMSDALKTLGVLGPKAAPLAPVLLLSCLSMLEVARYLPAHGSVRCRLVELAMDVFAAWRGITQDRCAAPRCVDEVLDVIAEQGVTSDVALLRRTAALREQIQSASLLYVDGGDATAVSDTTPQDPDVDSIATCFDLQHGDEYPAYISYCVRQVWSMAALDQLYQHGVRQLGRLQNTMELAGHKGPYGV